MPLFVIDDGSSSRVETIESMPGQYRFPIKELLLECETLAKLKIPAVALFPKINPILKDEMGSNALVKDNLVLRAVRSIKKHIPELTVITDVALDPYTSHGHDGVLNDSGTDVLNDKTVKLLCKMALASAEAGVDFVAPSDMMDGRIGAIRKALDRNHFTDVGIVAYSVKYNSAYYGPFRDAVGSAQAAGTRLLDKSTYQMDPCNRREALTEVSLDVEEGADVIMIKPAGPYLDIISDVRRHINLPVAAYQVSGEYSMIHAAARLGWLNLKRTRDESLIAIKRAGADLIFSYFAKDYVVSLEEINRNG